MVASTLGWVALSVESDIDRFTPLPIDDREKGIPIFGWITDPYIRIKPMSCSYRL